MCPAFASDRFLGFAPIGSEGGERAAAAIVAGLFVVRHGLNVRAAWPCAWLTTRVPPRPFWMAR
jgi:hypothetical protein